MLVPVDEAGAFYEQYGWLHGQHTADVRQPIIEDLGQRGRLLRAGEITHRYPTCWRCGTELIFRVVDEWFISADGVRERMIEANRDGRVDARLLRQADGGLAAQHGGLVHLPQALLGPAAAVLPRAVRQGDGGRLAWPSCASGRSTRAGRRPPGAAPAVDRRRPDPHRGGEIAERVAEVGDCWLDAGIVPFSTLGWSATSTCPRGTPGRRRGPDEADLPDHAYWEKWFPADWVSEMREQIRLWFYSQLFMSVVLVGRRRTSAVLGYEKLHDETGRPMHKSWGNAIWFDDAVEQDGRRRHALAVRRARTRPRT